MRNKNKNKHTIKITFDRKDDSHIFEVNDVTGREMLYAYNSLKNKIESTVGQPIDKIIEVAIFEEKRETKEREDS